MVSRLELSKVIAERTLGTPAGHRLEKAIAGYLLEEKRIDELDSIMRDVLAYRAEHGHVEATVVSAYPISEAVRRDVTAAVKSQYPGAKTFVINQKIDPGVVGGLRIEMAGEELDLTVQAKLNTFKRLTLSREK